MPDLRQMLSLIGAPPEASVDKSVYGALNYPDVGALTDAGLIKSVQGAYGTPAYYAPGPNAPQTKYGSPLDVRAYDQPSGQGAGGFKMIDPSLWYNDPNYGPITSSRNTVDPSKQSNFYDLIGPLIMSLVLGGAGMGAFGAVGAGQGAGLSAARLGQNAARYAGGR